MWRDLSIAEMRRTILATAAASCFNVARSFDRGNLPTFFEGRQKLIASMWRDLSIAEIKWFAKPPKKVDELQCGAIFRSRKSGDQAGEDQPCDASMWRDLSIAEIRFHRPRR